MKRIMASLAVFAGIVLPATAQEPSAQLLQPTVTLTQDELAALIRAEVSKALAHQVAQSVYDKVGKAFSTEAKDVPGAPAK